ncbi:hypothetical protein [Leptodesmis sp.]|uniref:hypothetical protein n=1 Tax=Leptodesmis sp. TaxID=3100501 RepID=UPI0040535796
MSSFGQFCTCLNETGSTRMGERSLLKLGVTFCIPILILTILSLLGGPMAEVASAQTPAGGKSPYDAINTGDTAWMLISTALVLFMTPGLAFF